MRYTWRRLSLLWAVLLVSGMPVSPAAGQQLGREMRREGDAVRFEIAFRDTRSRRHELRFDLSAASYRAAKSGLTAPDSPEVERRIERAVGAYVEKRRAAWRDRMRKRLNRLERDLPRHIDLQHGFGDDGLSWQLESREASRAELQQIAGRMSDNIERLSRKLVNAYQAKVERHAQQVRDRIYENLSYIRDPNLGVLRVDYRRVARRAAPRLEPVARALAKRAGGGTRERLSLALAFLQTIPYDRLTDRNAANGTGFATPVEMLHLNRGDCDSKATALAALMRRLAPEIRIAMVMLPGHAVLAADVPARPGDLTIRLRGERFVLTEPAGPALAPVGRIGDDSRRSIEANNVTGIVWMNG